MLEEIVRNAPVFLLVAARSFACIMSLPLFSSRTVPRKAKVALAGYIAYFAFPQLSLESGTYAAYASFISESGGFSADYIFLLIGEALIGLVIGFSVTLIFAAFSTAGQFFAFQMGFSASEVYDSMSEVENPLMGEYLNFIAMLMFLRAGGFLELFTDGLLASYRSLNVFSIIGHRDELLSFMLSGLTKLFQNALVIALPLMGTLFLINVCMGILAKAAPQMNLLAEGFPILILTSFMLLFLLLPQLCELFLGSFRTGFLGLQQLFVRLGGRIQ
ncbi:MAG TPA: flagellar biosynthetic protein FliR [Treponema sp.]|nr:flagellar biosynthetic protein FliR [Treponema sp.]